MRAAPILLMLASISALCCQTPPSLGQDQMPIVRQRAIAEMAVARLAVPLSPMARLRA